MGNEHGGSGSFLTDQQRGLMAAILDGIIPREGDFPGAGELGVADHIDETVAGSKDLKRLFAEGLKSVVSMSHKEYGRDFGSLSADERVHVLEHIESDQPAFFEELIHHAYAGYYINPEVLRVKGLQLSPPMPKGYALEPFDLSLLESVKKRGQVYRDV